MPTTSPETSVSSSCIVLVASAAQLSTLTELAAQTPARLLAFADTDARRAVGIIAERRPQLVVLEQRFADTVRGIALIRRIRGDPALAHAEIRTVSPGADSPPVVPVVADSSRLSGPPTALPAKPDLRRAARIKLTAAGDVLVEGQKAALVDLSPLGAQVVAAAALKPKQRIRLSLADGQSTLRMSATVVWASFEIAPASGPQYRAGLEFHRPRSAGAGDVRRQATLPAGLRRLSREVMSAVTARGVDSTRS